MLGDRPAAASGEPDPDTPAAVPLVHLDDYRALPPRPILTPAALEALTGEYYSPEAETTFTVSVDGGRLVLRRRPVTRLVLTPVETDLFTAGPLGRVRFIRDDSGRVTQLSVQQARVYDLRFERVR
jgi:hypothetical protein